MAMAFSSIDEGPGWDGVACYRRMPRRPLRAGDIESPLRTTPLPHADGGFLVVGSPVLPVLSDGAKKIASFFGRMASKKGGKFEAGWGRLPIPTYW